MFLQWGVLIMDCTEVKMFLPEILVCILEVLCLQTFCYYDYKQTNKQRTVNGTVGTSNMMVTNSGTKIAHN